MSPPDLPLLASAQRRLRRVLDAGLADLLSGGLMGIEKECLRVAPDGLIAQTPHPPGLGSALTHAYLTTDFSEALLEIITPPLADRRALIQFLADAHAWVHRHLDQEILWAASMPCRLQGPASVPIAQYGPSNAGRMKTLYRQGLAYRYGRLMQTIAGVHCNYSLPAAWWPAFQELEGDSGSLQDFTSSRYFGMVRNLQRLGWLVPYLFGASPVVSASFLAERTTDLRRFSPDTYGYPHATSLRMGDIGYQNSLEEGRGFRPNYDSLDAYVRSLTWAMETPCPDYEAIGVRVNGEYRQLSAAVLQIENEHYSSVRPKQPPQWLEKPSLALRRRGVAYVELRSLDLNPYEPLGVTEDQLYFLEVLLIFSLLADSPRIPAAEARAINRNQILTAHRGREPGLELFWEGRPRSLQDLVMVTLAAMEPLAEALDRARTERPYRRVLERQRTVAAAPERTASARMLVEIQGGEEFLNRGHQWSEDQRRQCLAWPLSTQRQGFFASEAEASRARQTALEQGDDRSFDRFLEDYFTQAG